MVEAEGDQGEGEIGRENGVKGRKEGSWKRSKKWGWGRGEKRGKTEMGETLR